MDLIRELLLRVESFDTRAGTQFVLTALAPELTIDGYNPDQVEQHLSWLIDYGYIEGGVGADLHFVIGPLSTPGCDLLDSIRNPEIWRLTKAEAEQAGGFTVDLLRDIAKAIIRARIEKTGEEKKLGDLLTLKPSIYGVGVDLKEAGRRIRERFKKS
jgi:hypothetical protein